VSDVVIRALDLSKQYQRGSGTQWSLTQLLGQAAARGLGHWTRQRAADATSRRDWFWALRDVTFSVERGERVGIIGRNGAGKSTLLKILARVVYPTSGEARIRGRVASLLEVGTGFNANLTGRENIYISGSMHGLTRRELAERYDDIVEFSGIAPFIDTPVKRYSSGMYMRLAFSVAAHLDPDVLLLDEVLAVGDLAFQQKCLERVDGLTRAGRTVLFVSHSMDAVARLCSRVIWMANGRIAMDGLVTPVIEAYVADTLQVSSSRIWGEHAPGSPPANVSGGTDRHGVNGNGIASVAVMAEPMVDAPSPANGILEDAPGNEHVRLIGVRAVNGRRETTLSANIDEPIGIEITYDVLQKEKILLPSLRLYSATGAHVFNAVYTDPTYMFQVKPVGRYVSTAWIPGNLLNSGVVHVTVGIATPGPTMERHVLVERAISFHVQEVAKIEGTARGVYTREFPGPVRPKLDWETTPL
jgi:lipopolysaccharide transport system ATP-binding protein